jgi:ABC-type sugar transport system permease subunit
VYTALVIMGVWSIGAGLIINLAALKNIPTELYDAARIDGAGSFAQLRFVTVPMMSPVIFYSLILSVVGVLQYFLVPLVIHNGTGDPGGATMFYNLYLYKTFFTFQNMSYGATLAWLLFGISLLLTLFLFRASRRFVYYAGER